MKGHFGKSTRINNAKAKESPFAPCRKAPRHMTLIGCPGQATTRSHEKCEKQKNKKKGRRGKD